MADTNAPELDFEPLRQWGFAPGSYTGFCSECGRQHTADKRAWRCLECAEKRADLTLAREGALIERAAEALDWEDTRRVHFDDSVMWSKGYDFDPWEDLREEANTCLGRFAVWKCPCHGWSYYGGELGWHKGGFPDEAAVKDAVRSNHIRALTTPDATAALTERDERIRKEAVKAERERCANIASSFIFHTKHDAGGQIAAAIRRRRPRGR